MDYEAHPTCGLATATALIGEADAPRYFAHPDRMSAEILWLGRGYVEYIIPALLPPSTKIDQITLSLEISAALQLAVFLLRTDRFAGLR